MMKRSSITIVLLFAIFAFGTPIPSYATNHEPANNIETERGGVKGAAKGCASGAIAGTVVPGLGNLIGCAIGGIAGWFWWKPESVTSSTEVSGSAKAA